jgi:signal transduction histidine kinase
MPRGRWRVAPRSLRGRLALAVAAVLVAAFLATFYLVYHQADARLRTEIDHALRVQAASFGGYLSPPGTRRSVTQLVEAAATYVTTQPFSASSRLLFAVAGGKLETNEPEELGQAPPDSDDTPSQTRHEAVLARALLRRPPGLWTLIAPDVGPLRLYVAQVRAGDGAVARIGVGEPLASVDDALDGITRGFAVGGTLTLAAALLAALLLAAGFTRPLRRMARIAAQVDAGDLSPRIDYAGSGSEMRILADAFDHMLDRLEHAFARQLGFVSDASHELRTPLTAIRGQLEVLARSDSPSPTEVRRVQRLVATEVDRMTRLTEDLLALARTDEARLVAREPIELRRFLVELCASAEPTAERTLRVEAETDGILRADRDRIAQALRNLLRNATEHTAPGGSVVLGAREVAGQRVQIWVDDDGPGIDPAERERVFDRFHRADAARTRNHGGAGLGLAIVRAIVEAHGGRVWAEQAPAGGARVVIELPGYSHQRLETAPGVS